MHQRDANTEPLAKHLPAHPAAKPRPLTAWWLATRPKTLLASICPVTIGTALAVRDGGFAAGPALAALAGAIAIQIGTNFCNDYCDFQQGADTDRRLGPTRAVQAGWISPAQMLVATILVFAAVAGIAAYLTWHAGWPLAVVGLLSIVAGIGYTAGPRSLAYLGVADGFVLLFFGPVAVAGTYYVQTLRLPWPVVVAGLAPGLISTALLVVNNLRDIEEDRAAGKRTLAVRLGADFVRYEYFVCLLGAQLVPVILVQVQYLPPVTIISIIPLWPGIWVWRQLWVRTGSELNPLLGGTAAVLLGYAVTFSASCLWV